MLLNKSAIVRLLTALPLMVVLLAGCLPQPQGRAVANAPAPTATPSPEALGPESPETATPRPTAAQARPAVPKAGAEAYDFTLNNLDGEPVTLSDLRGKKVMLNFWASWCGPCRIEIPHMIAVYDEYHEDGLEIVAVNLRETQETAEQAVEALKMPFTILLDEQGDIGRAYYVRGIPTSVFINEEGIIESVQVGSLSEELLRQHIEALMQ